MNKIRNYMDAFTFEEWWEIGKEIGGKKETAEAAWKAREAAILSADNGDCNCAVERATLEAKERRLKGMERQIQRWKFWCPKKELNSCGGQHVTEVDGDWVLWEDYAKLNRGERI